MVLDNNYITLKTQVIKAERRVLKDLGFCVHVKHPHKLIVMYLQVLGYEQNQPLMQMAWNFMNDSLRTDVFVRYNPETIACACIYLTGRKLNLPLPNNPPWYAIFRVTEEEIVDICFKIMDLYRRHKPNVEVLEAKVDELRKKYNEQRNKRPGMNTPPMAVTTADPKDGSHNAWGGFISRALPPDAKLTIINHTHSTQLIQLQQQQQQQQQPQELQQQQQSSQLPKQQQPNQQQQQQQQETQSKPSSSSSVPSSNPHQSSQQSQVSYSQKKSHHQSSRNYSRSSSASPRKKRLAFPMFETKFKTCVDNCKKKYIKIKTGNIHF